MAAPKSFDIVVVGAGLSGNRAAQEVLKLSTTATVGLIHGFTFQEVPLGSALFLNDPGQHVKFTSGDPEKFKRKNDRLTYFLSSVETCDCDTKQITLMAKGPDAGAVITYKSLIVATGCKMPLFTPTPGQSLVERIAEVRATAAALKQSSTVVFNGAGLVGLEMCGDFRSKHGYQARVVLLTRSGKILETDFGDKARKPKPDFVDHVVDILTNKFKVEIKQASVSDPDFAQPRLKPGTIKFDDGESMAYDVYIPCFSQGPNTAFLKSSNPDMLEKLAIKSNECLQSTAHPEIFGVGVTTTKLYGHPAVARVEAAAMSAARNALLVSQGKQPLQHVDKVFPPPMDHPVNVKIGHGKGSYGLWTNLPLPAKICCCLPCKGGYPCCPPPCCWFCVPGCSGAFGQCCGPSGEGEGPAVFFPEFLRKGMSKHGFIGIGDYGPSVVAPQQQVM